MKAFEVLSLLQHEIRNLAWPNEILEQLPRVTRRRADGRNEVAAYCMDAEGADLEIGRQVEYFTSVGESFEWKVLSFDEPRDLKDRLGAAGFEIGPKEAVVVYALSQGLEALEADSCCAAVRITGSGQLSDFRSVAEEVFGKDYSFTTGQLASALESGETGHRGYVGYIEGKPASVGRLYTNPLSRFAGLYGGGTLAEYRGRGCYRSLVAARARDGLASGAEFLMVDALPTSLPILLRLGFEPIAETWACTFTCP